MSLLDRVRTYYEACNSGDADRVAACFAPDAVHHFNGGEPQRGGAAIAAGAAGAVHELGARWRVDHGIEQGAEAVVEWTMEWTRRRSGAPAALHGTEWIVFGDDGRIREVRAYYDPAS